MSQVSPVFYTEETLSIGLKYKLKVRTLIQNITENRLRHARDPVQ